MALGGVKGAMAGMEDGEEGMGARAMAGEGAEGKGGAGKGVKDGVVMVAGRED